MSNNAVAIAAIVMAGLLVSVIAWQLLAIARTAVARKEHSRDRQPEKASYAGSDSDDPIPD